MSYYPEEERWSRDATVYTTDNPPASRVLPEKLGLLPVPETWEPLTGVREWPEGLELWRPTLRSSILWKYRPWETANCRS